MFHVEQKKGRRLLTDLFANLFISTKIALIYNRKKSI